MGDLGPFEFLRDDGFQQALAGGALAAVVVAALAAIRTRSPGRRSRDLPLPLAGVALVVPAVLVLARHVDVPDGTLAGLAALALAGAAWDGTRLPLPVALILAAPGAWLLGWHGGLAPVDWIRATVVATTLVGGVTMASFDQRWYRDGYAPALVAVTAVGVYYTVPDTYHAIVVLGTSLPAALLGWPNASARLGASGAFAVAGLLAWTVASDGIGRQSSIVGGMACVGLLFVEPVSRGLRATARSALDAVAGWRRWAVAVGAHLALVFVASRVAGVRDPAEYVAGGTLWRGAVAPALTIVALELAVAFAFAMVLRWRVGR